MPAIGAHTVTVTPPGGAAVDFSCWCTAVDIRYGRDDPGSQPDASTATLSIVVNPSTGDLPAAVEIGSAVVVDTAGHRRFTGRISDIALGWDEAGVDTPDAGTGQVVAAGVLADTGRAVVGDVAYPQELDGARVARAMTAAGYTLNPTFSDPGTVQVLPRTADPAPALDISQGAAQSASGVVWATRAGEVRYADAAHRKGTPSSLTLDVCDILVTPTWRRTLEGMVNAVSVAYGVDASAGVYTADNPTSKARYGTYGASLSTLLASVGDASALGQLLMVRNSFPVWVMSDLPVDLYSLDATRYATLLELEMHQLLTLTGMPTVGGAPTTALLWVEGWAEHLEYGVHELSLVTSGYCRTAPAPQWDQTDPAWTWDTMDAALTWDDTTCLGPPVNYGRWNDQPANLRWDQVAPSRTWDTYGG